MTDKKTLLWIVCILALLVHTTGSASAARQKNVSRQKTAVSNAAVSMTRALVNVPVAGVYMRSNHSSERVTEVLLGDEFRVISISNDWIYGSIPSQKDYRGWIGARNIITPADNRFLTSQTFVQVKAKNTKIMMDDGSTIAVASCTRLPLIRKNGALYEVLLPGGLTGTLPAGSCVVEDEEFGRGVTPEDIMYAAEFLGSDYKWGGITASGMDCSGFVYSVFRVNGIYLKRDSYMQAGEGVDIPVEDLKPGDLVFFKSKGAKRITHVGIYIGYGNFIHASKSNNSVTISSLSEGYYKRGLVAARRILNSERNHRAAGNPVLMQFASH
ncbi:MAG: hypothetical protein C0402_09565 [Thermodesulfovibrio sp.]|nr:hypothetical protein [Thermodesulfovibrio sp.]